YDASNSASMSDSNKRKAKAHERQAAIVEKMKAHQSKLTENEGSTSSGQTAMNHDYSNPFINSSEQQERLREALLSCGDKQIQSYILYDVVGIERAISAAIAAATQDLI
nr:DExH-box ATP-dependent RNA helicase DExH17 [Tanacetum cinerariifolium]